MHDRRGICGYTDHKIVIFTAMKLLNWCFNSHVLKVVFIHLVFGIDFVQMS